MAFENGFSSDELVSVAERKWNSFVESRKGIPCGASGFRSAELLGVVTSLPRAKEKSLNEPLVIVSVTLPSDVELGARSSRKRQFDFAKSVIQAFAENPPCPLKGSVAHGLFAFSDDYGNFRLSLVTSHYDERAKLAFNSFRRQSFFVEAGKKNVTFRRYFLDRSSAACQTLADVREAFSVEALTKEFYTEIEKWFLWARKEVTFPMPADSRMNASEHNSTQTLRLITRLIFIWFLKQKKLVPAELFEPAKINELLNFSNKTKSIYYKAILQNLFFATLNTPLDKRAWVNRQAGKQEFFRYKRYFKNEKKFEYLVNICGKVPFVNGGLFENLDGKNEDGSPDETRRLDCFSNRRDNETRLVVPDELFLSEKDVKIKVPRKNGLKEEVTTGILTTLARFDFTITENSPSDEDVSLDPELLGRVFENLLAYVNPETSEQARKATGSFYTPREIVNYMVDEALKAYLGDAEKLSPKELERKLKAVRVLDPACGSGAFPMGILTRIIELLEEKGTLNPDDAGAVYQTKLDLIKNCIYGVDIQNIAVQISKLRFFISLLCEQKTNDNRSDNFGVSVLPNLETKFVAANSLIAKKKRAAQGDLFEDPEIDKTRKRLDDLRDAHFGAQTPEEKQRIRKADEKERQKLAKLLEANGIFAPDDAKQIALWNPYDPNAVAPFFDAATMFGVKDGFDIVIGNPPYVQVPKGIFSPIIFPYSEGKDKGKQNLYKVFVEHCYNQCKATGIGCMIVQSSLLGDVSSTFTRELLLTKTRLDQILEFPKSVSKEKRAKGEESAFESVLQGTCIFLFSKQDKNLKHKTLISIGNNRASIRNPIFATLSQQNVLEFSPAHEIPLIQPKAAQLYRKIKECSTRLNDFLVDSAQGNINTIYLKEIQSSKPTGAFIAKGAHIHRYALSNEKLFYCKETKSTKEIFAKNQNGFLVLTQNITGTTDKYRIHAYFLECRNTRIVFLDSVNISYSRSLDDGRYLVALLNSKLIDWTFRVTSTNNHVNIYELNNLPIKNPSSAEQERIVKQVDDILKLKAKDADADTSAMERKIDELVYKLYGLTEEEIAIVEGAGDGLPRRASAARNDGDGGRVGDKARHQKKGKIVGYRPEIDGEDE